MTESPVQRSTAVRLLRRTATRLRAGLRHSRLRALLSVERPATTLSAGPSGLLGPAADGSILARTVRGGEHPPTLAAATANARLGEALRRVVTASVLYRWLTSEPDPDVIVIDLRDTYSVGPALTTLERTLSALLPGVATSSVGTVVQAVGAVLRTQPIRAASFTLLGVLTAAVSFAAIMGALTAPLVVGAVVATLAALVGLRSRASLEELGETSVVQTLGAALEPPAPPERESERDIDASSGKREPRTE